MVGQGKVLLGVIGEALTPLLYGGGGGKLGFVCATLGDGVSRGILMFQGRVWAR